MEHLVRTFYLRAWLTCVAVLIPKQAAVDLLAVSTRNAGSAC